MSKQSKQRSMILSFAVAVTALALSPEAWAIPLPSVVAEASATASTPGDDAGTVSDSGPTTATATNTASGSGFADSFGQATVGGAARSRALVDSASGLAEASNAEGTARWVGQIQTGGIDPGAPIDIDLGLNVDGVLSYFNNNTNVSTGDLLSSVALRLTLFDELTGATGVFDGSATLSGISRFVPPELIRTGSWADASRDGDFTVGACGAFSCVVDVTATILVPDALLVGFGDTFGVEVELLTNAFQAQGRETGASADFSNTVSVDLSTSTPGITFTPVPEPGTALLVGLGLATLAGVRRSR
jgi:hypothetical protein